MSASVAARRVVAELHSGEDRPAWSLIGSRSIHQFWALLSPHFREVLLPPQRRPDGGGVSWTWREATGNQPLTAAELSDVRRRLEKADRSFAGKSSESPANDEQGEGDGVPDLGSQTRATVHAMVSRLTTASDSTLAGFVGRTEIGPMVHSWGATIPARPYFPDARDCEISGIVLVGEESADGLKVVLENRQGAILARIQADAAGTFCFQKIGPGDYRIRVADRGDFPATGFAVTVERESIVGLELHRGSAVATFAGSARPAAALSEEETETPATIPDSAAAAETTAERPPRRSRRRAVAWVVVLVLLAAGGGGWHFASRPTGDAQLAGTSQPWWRTAIGSVNGSTSLTDSSVSHSETRTIGGISRSSNGGGTPMSRGTGATPVGFQQREIRSPAVPGRSTIDSPQFALKIPPSLDLKPSVNASPVENLETSDGNPPTAESPSEHAAALGTPTDPAPSAKKMSGRIAAAPTRRAGSGSANEAPGAESNSSGETQAAGSSAGVGGAASARMAATPSSVAAAQVRANGANKSADSPVAAAVATAESAGGTVAPESSVDPKSSNSSRSARRQTGTGSLRTPSRGPTPSSDKSEDNVDANAYAAASAKRPPHANRGPVAADPMPSVSKQTDSPAGAEDLRPPLRPAVVRAENETRMQGLRVSVSAWTPRLLQDAILPTHPVPAGEDDALASAREKLIRERQASMPPAFQHPETTSGFALEFDGDGAAPENEPRWRNALGAELVGTSVRGNRAEVSWPGSNPPNSLDVVLLRPDGRELARLVVDAQGRPSLTTLPAVRSWFWVGIECRSADEASAFHPEPRRQFDWRLLSGSPMPVSWRQDNHWRNGRGYRIDLFLATGTAPRTSFPLALVDPVTGWAIVGEVTRL